MSVELYRESPGKFDSRTLKRKTLNRWAYSLRAHARLGVISPTTLIQVNPLYREIPEEENHR